MKALTGTLILRLSRYHRVLDNSGSPKETARSYWNVCLNCHGNSLVQAAPPPAVIKQMTPERIYWLSPRVR